ncbi:hypothetical protein ACJW31_11G095100 [Castanea mollissima]
MKLKKKTNKKNSRVFQNRIQKKKIAPHSETEKLKSSEAKLELKCEARRTSIDESSLEIEFCRERERELILGFVLDSRAVVAENLLQERERERGCLWVPQKYRER